VLKCGHWILMHDRAKSYIDLLYKATNFFDPNPNASKAFLLSHFINPSIDVRNLLTDLTLPFSLQKLPFVMKPAQLNVSQADKEIQEWPR